jgi:hypothetical protein
MISTEDIKSALILANTLSELLGQTKGKPKVTIASAPTASGGGGGTPSDTVVTEKAFGQSEAAGSSTDYSRGDHTHGTPTAYDPFARRFFYTPYGCDFPFYFTGSGATGGNQISELILTTGEEADSSAIAAFIPGWSILPNSEYEATISEINSYTSNLIIQLLGLHRTPTICDPYQIAQYYGTGIWHIHPEGPEFGQIIAVTSNGTERQTTVMMANSEDYLYGSTVLIKLIAGYICFYINGELKATHNDTLSGASIIWISQSVKAVGVCYGGDQTFNSIRAYSDVVFE